MNETFKNFQNKRIKHLLKLLDIFPLESRWVSQEMSIWQEYDRLADTGIIEIMKTGLEKLIKAKLNYAEFIYLYSAIIIMVSKELSTEFKTNERLMELQKNDKISFDDEWRQQFSKKIATIFNINWKGYYNAIN